MHTSRAPKDVVITWAEKLAAASDSDFAYQFVRACSRLSAKDWENLAAFAHALFNAQEATPSPPPVATHGEQADIDAEVEAYRQQLLVQRERERRGQGGKSSTYFSGNVKEA